MGIPCYISQDPIYTIQRPWHNVNVTEDLTVGAETHEAQSES